MRPSLEMGEFGTREAGGRAINADRLRVRPSAPFCLQPAAPLAETLA